MGVCLLLYLLFFEFVLDGLLCWLGWMLMRHCVWMVCFRWVLDFGFDYNVLLLGFAYWWFGFDLDLLRRFNLDHCLLLIVADYWVFRIVFCLLYCVICRFDLIAVYFLIFRLFILFCLLIVFNFELLIACWVAFGLCLGTLYYFATCDFMLGFNLCLLYLLIIFVLRLGLGFGFSCWL